MKLFSRLIATVLAVTVLFDVVFYAGTRTHATPE